MFDRSEGLGLGCHSRLAGGTVALAAACLAVAGCSAASPGSQQASHEAATAAPAGTSSANMALSNVPLNSEFASPSSRVAPPDPLGPPADPFAGTPADHWADGAAGIVVPAATPVGPYSKAQVEYAYQTTRKLLIAANLDKQTLLGGTPAAFADLLTSPQRTWFEQGLNKKGVDKTGGALSTRPLVMSFEPGSAQLVGSVIKVNGTMHAKAGKDGKELDVSVDYLFVYPIEPPHRPDSWMRIVNEVAWTVAFADWQGASSSFAPWVTDTGVGGVAGADCGTTDGYSHPDYPSSAVPGATPSVTPSGTPIDPYVAGQSRTAGCQASTGT
jgi:hypothetical protein